MKKSSSSQIHRQVHRQMFMYILFVLAVVMLAACSSDAGQNKGGDPVDPPPANGNADTNTNTNTNTDVKEPERKLNDTPATLTFMTRNGMSEDVFQAFYADAVHKKFPHYTLNQIIISEKYGFKEIIAAGETVDIYAQYAHSIAREMLSVHLEYDMTELTKQHNIDLSRFDPESIEQINKLGGLYGLPVYSTVVALFYNKSIFDKFGMDYINDGMTWNETLELSKRFNRSEGGKTYVGFWHDVKPYLRGNQLSLSLVDPATLNATLNNEGWKRIIDLFFRSFAENEQMQELLVKWPNRNIFLRDQHAAMYGMLFNRILLDKEFEELDWDMVALPVFEDLPKIGSQAMHEYLAIPSFSKQKDQAMEVVDFLTSVEFQTSISKQGNMTTLRDDGVRKALGQETRFKDKNMMAVYYNQIAESRHLTAVDEFVVEDGLDKKVLREIAQGMLDVNSGLREAEEISNQKIAADIGR